MIGSNQTKCIICFSDDHDIILSFFKPDQYEVAVGVTAQNYQRHWVKCNKCGFFYSIYSRDPMILDRIYDTAYRDEMASWRSDSIRNIFKKIIKLPRGKSETHYRIEWIKRNIKQLVEIGFLNLPIKNRKLLDVGGANGVFAYLFKDKEWTAEIVDPSEEGIFIEKEYGIRYYKNTFVLETLKKYDLISLVFVLEHIRDPIAILSKVYSSLSKNALVYIEVPDAISFKRKDHRDDIFNSCHLWMFDPDSLIKVTSLCGFTTLKLQRVRTLRGHYSVMYLGMAK